MHHKQLSVIAFFGLSLIVGCGGSSSSGDSNEPSDTTVAQTTENEATWVINGPGDAYSAPAAQTVCDLMRSWAPPIETSATQVAELQKYADSLRRLIGSPSDAMYSASHAKILGHAEALLINEEKYPSDDSMPASFGWIDGNCEDLGLTPENSKFGLKGASATNSAPITAPSLTVVDKDKILSAICTTVPKELQASGYSGEPVNIYMCDRNGSHITMQVSGPTDLARFEERFPTVKLIESQLLCGDSWKLNFQKPDYSAGNADILSSELSKVGIQSGSC